MTVRLCFYSYFIRIGPPPTINLPNFRFDGFRFDGVTSMLYKHHGIAHCFTGDYGDYYQDHLEIPAINYLVSHSLDLSILLLLF